MDKESYLLAVGCYTSGTGEGLYSYFFDPSQKRFGKLASARVTNPSYLALCADKKCLYAVSENTDTPSYANVFSIESQTGRFKRKGRRTTKGEAPCYVAADPDSCFVATANYAGGSVSVFPLDEEGNLEPVSQVIRFSGRGTDPERQEAPHIHCVGFSPDGRYLFATDLGTDSIYRFEVEHTGGKTFLNENTKTVFPVDPGSGPRHFRFSPDGKYFYLVNELSGAVMAFGYREGVLSPLQTISIGDTFRGDGGDIVLTPDGKYLYASLREGDDGIGIFSVDRKSGRLAKTDYLRTAAHPRNLAVSPDGKFLMCAAVKNHLVEAYFLDPETGRPVKTDARIEIDSPACVVFME